MWAERAGDADDGQYATDLSQVFYVAGMSANAAWRAEMGPISVVCSCPAEKLRNYSGIILNAEQLY